MTVYHFTELIVWDNLAGAVRVAAGVKSLTLVDPLTGLTPTLTQGGVTVGYVTADSLGRVTFTATVDTVRADFGAGAQLLYSDERLTATSDAAPALAAAATAQAGVDEITTGVLGSLLIDPAKVSSSSRVMDWVTGRAYVVGELAVSGGAIYRCITAHTSSGGFDGSKFLAVSASGSYGMLAAANGVVGNGVADDGAALNALLVSAATFGAPVILAPKSVVFTTVRIVIPSGTRLNGNGATIKCGITSSIYLPTIGLNDVSNVIIENLVVDGNKAAFAPATEWKHGIQMVTATDVVIRNCTLNSSKGDGIEIAGDNAGSCCQRVTLDNITAKFNHRNALSVESCKTLRVIGGTYSNTSGTAPQVGIDIEPNGAPDVIDDLVFVGVTATANTGGGLSVLLSPTPTGRQQGVVFTACNFSGNPNAGVDLINAYHCTFTDCQVSDNTGAGYEMDGIVNHLTIRGGTVLRNAAQGIMGTATTMNDWLIFGVRVLDNTGYGIHLNGTGSRFVIASNVVGNDTTSATLYGIATDAATLTYVSVLNNDARACGTYSAGLTDQASTRNVSGNRGFMVGAIAAPTSDTVGTKAAIDAIRAALTASGITA